MSIRLSDGERLIVFMLADIYKHLKIKNPEIDPDFITKAVVDGHDWALQSRYSGLFHSEVDSEEDVKETHEILTMFHVLQSSYERLSAADKKVDAAVPPFTGKDLYFKGFDGNHDAHHGIADFMVNELGLYDEQKRQAMNSHGSVLEAYRRMFRVYETLLGNMGTQDGPSADQLIEVLKSKVHPSRR